MAIKTSVLLNDFAIRCFRDMADQDYVMARTAFRAQLVSQFLWCSLQAIEKYFKCILLLNRVQANTGHNLDAALILIDTKLPFKVRLSVDSRELIEHLDRYGRFRYLETSFHIKGEELVQLDRAVWELRRYCRVIDTHITLQDGTKQSILSAELRRIEQAENLPPQRFKVVTGKLEKIIASKKHPARANLVWLNLYFGSSTRKQITYRSYSEFTNSPLSLRPDMLDEVLKYVFLPRDVKNAYRAEIAKRAKNATPPSAKKP